MAFYDSNGFKYIKNLWIGVGAGFIIIGALWKIMHWQNANEILTAAMLFEASIFFLQAILPPPKEYKWERVYPDLMNQSIKVKRGKHGENLASKLNNSLAAAKMDDSAIDNLGSHLRTLGDNIGKLTSTTDSVAATEEYSRNAKEAAAALGQVKEAYSKAAAVAVDLAGASDSTRAYHEQVQAITKNLATLNTVYELELQDTNNHLKAMNKFYGNLTTAVSNLNESIDDTKIYKENMKKLSTNLSALNGVYGSMLGAMAQVRPSK